MKKKKIIVAVLVILILGMAVVLGWKLHVLKQEPEEERYVTNVRAMYGTADYLGPMEEEVEPLTEEEIKDLNPIRMPYMEYDEQFDCMIIYGRFNTSKIENIYDARVAISRALQYAGQICDEDTLMYGNVSLGAKERDIYDYDYFYKGVQCAGIHVTIWVDKEGNSERIWFDSGIEDIGTLESVVPVYRGEKLQALLDERYGKCEIRHKWLNICWYGEEYGLEWCIEFDAENSPIHMIWMNANTGEIGAEDPMEPVY